MQDPHIEPKEDITNEPRKEIVCPQCGHKSEISSQNIRCLRCNYILVNQLSINKQCQGNCHKCRKSH
jgi:hypothetical protein